MDCAFEQIVKRMIDSLSTKNRQYIDPVEHCVEVSAEAIKADKYIFVCGNGGSASTASHIANDLLCHLKNWNRKNYKVLALTDNVAAITSLTNDYGFQEVFSRQLKAFGSRGDVLWAFSTSGNSKNCVKAIETAKEMGIYTVGITGSKGGCMKDLADLWMPVASDEVTRVEELHMIYAHILAENIETVVSPEEK